MSSDSDSGGGFLYAFFVIVIYVFISCRGCMAIPDGAKHHLESMGFSEVTIVSNHWFMVFFRGCGADAAMFKTSATNVKGEVVKVNVCAGWPFKGTTVRGR